MNTKDHESKNGLTRIARIFANSIRGNWHNWRQSLVAKQKRWTNYFAGSKVKIVKHDMPKNLMPNNCHASLSTMRIFISLALFSLALLCGCSSGKHYVRGRGDVGQFILQHAVAYGGHPMTTNGLPTIEGDWQYVQDDYGIYILLAPSQYQPVQDFVRAAFGPPSNSAGWSVRDFGVAIMVQKTASNTGIGLYPPMSDEKMAQGIREMNQSIEKGTR